MLYPVRFSGALSALWLATNTVAAGALGIVFRMAVTPGLVAALVTLIGALMLGLAVGLLTQRRTVGRRARRPSVEAVPKPS
jgi:dipeptide/tripeptide permease